MGLPLGDFNTSTAYAQYQIGYINQPNGYAFGNYFAENGTAASVDFSYPLQKHKLELTCTMGYNYNPFDINNYTNLLYLQEGYLPTDINTTGYNIFTFLPGIKYPITKGKLKLYIKFRLGLLICETPGFSYTEYYIAVYGYSNPIHISKNSEIQESVALSLGAEATYHLSKKKYLLFNADQISPAPSYGATSTVLVTLLNLKLGAGFDL